jgi:hypothetical protein
MICVINRIVDTMLSLIICLLFSLFLFMSVMYMIVIMYRDIPAIEKYEFSNVGINYEKALQVYQVVLNGAGTRQDVLSLTQMIATGEMRNDIQRLKSDVLKGAVTHIMLCGHPYKLSLKGETKYYMSFKIENKCSVFPFPECPTAESINDSFTQVVHVLGYRVQE